MNPLRLFISSVQDEFAAERSTLRTGTRDMIRRCREAGLPDPVFTVTDGFVITLRRPEPAATPVEKLLRAAETALSREELQRQVGLADRKHFRETLLNPLLESGWVAMTIPETPTSRLQKYRLTEQGRAWLASLAPRPVPPSTP